MHARILLIGAGLSVAACYMLLPAAATAANPTWRDRAAYAASAMFQEVRRIEKEVEKAEPEDSPLSLAKAKFFKARQDHADAVKGIVDSHEYQSGLERLGPVLDRQPEDVAKLRADKVKNNPRVRELADKQAKARDEYITQRKKVFEADSRWQRAVAAIKSAYTGEDPALIQERMAKSDQQRREMRQKHEAALQEQARRAALQAQQFQQAQAQAQAQAQWQAQQQANADRRKAGNQPRKGQKKQNRPNNRR